MPVLAGVYWYGSGPGAHTAWDIRLRLGLNGELQEALHWEDMRAHFLPTAGAPTELEAMKKHFEVLWELER